MSLPGEEKQTLIGVLTGLNEAETHEEETLAATKMSIGEWGMPGH